MTQMTHEIEEVYIGDDLYNITFEIEVDIEGGVEVSCISSCYKHVDNNLEVCEPNNLIKEVAQDYIDSHEEEYTRIIKEHIDWNSEY